MNTKIYVVYVFFQPQPIDPLLKTCIGDFLSTLQDEDLTVRRVALVTFNSAAHNKPSLIRDLLETVLPHLYNETKVRVSGRNSYLMFWLLLVVIFLCSAPFISGRLFILNFHCECILNYPVTETPVQEIN